MTKKYLALILCGVLLLTNLVIFPVHAAEDDAVIASGYDSIVVVSEAYSENPVHFNSWANGYGGGVEPESADNPNYVAKLKFSEYIPADPETGAAAVTPTDNAATVATGLWNTDWLVVNEIPFPDAYVLEFDVLAKDNSTALTMISRPDSIYNIRFNPDIFETDKWYTIRIFVDDKGMKTYSEGLLTQVVSSAKVYMEERDNPFSGRELTYYVDYKIGNSSTSFGWGAVGFAIYGRSGFAWLSSEDSGDKALKDAKNIEYFPAAFDAEYWLDNISVYDMKSSFVNEVFFVNGENLVKELSATGTVTPKFRVENFGGLQSATAITVVYDKNGYMKTKVTAPVTLTTGFVTVEGASVDVAEAQGGGRIEAFLWTNENEMIPVGGVKGVLGFEELVNGSETTAVLGTDGERKTNSFSSFDRSVIADKLNISGKHSTETFAAVSVKVAGKTSGKVLLETQLMTTEDGSFSKDFMINPELCGEDKVAIVTVSGIDTTEKTFEIPVASNWNDMKTDFVGMSKDNVESYFDTYKENLTYCDAGIDGFVVTNVESLDDGNYADIYFLKSMMSLEDLTFEQVVKGSVELIEKSIAAKDFMDSFSEAKALETQSEKIEAIRTLFENCTFMDFDTTGVSNVDAIARMLISSDAQSIESFNEAFVAAYETQKGLEEATIPGFTEEIENGNDIKNFFMINETVLGISPEAYSDADYAVMYDVYVEKQYNTLTTYEEVNGAIVFLDGYIKEYNSFLENITNATSVEKNWETIKTVLNGNFDYLTVNLTDSSEVVCEEYLYERMFDIDCSTLEKVENAFLNAVSAQKDYENTAKNQFNQAFTKDLLKAFFAEFADMMDVSDAKMFTDKELELLAEIQCKFAPSAESYSEAVEMLSDALLKFEDAKAFVNDVNAKSELLDWTGLKVLYEGETYAEFVGASTATTQINDIRAMYLRIADKAPFDTLTQIKEAFFTSYEEQRNYEAIAGGYDEDVDDEMLFFDESQWELSVMANVITVAGKVNKNGVHHIMLAVDDGTNLAYIKQLVTETNGHFEFRIILNPELYDADCEGTLSVSGDGINTYHFSPFELYSEEELQGMVDEYKQISTKQDMKSFLENYGDSLGLIVDTNDDSKMAAMIFLFDKYKKQGDYDDVFDTIDLVNGTTENSGAEALIKQMNSMVACLEEITKAATVKVGNTIGRWSVIKSQVELAIENGWMDPDVSGTVDDTASLFLKMAGKNKNYRYFTDEYMPNGETTKDVQTAYEEAYNAQIEEEKANKKQNGSGSGGGGGGGFSGSTSNGGDGKTESAGSSGNLTDTVIGNTPQDELPENNSGLPLKPFSDVTSQYSWASEAINGLRKYGLVSGDGDGKFRPGASISREEFLTMLFNVFEIERTSNSVSFTDIDANAWYAKTVATAYEMGIVEGYPDGTFGAGKTISRAEMAVMVQRMFEKFNIEMEYPNAAVVFGDAAEIPQYADVAISKLQQAGILNGDEFGFFNPNSNLTRAEAAVVCWAVFDNISDIVKYYWVNPY